MISNGLRCALALVFAGACAAAVTPEARADGSIEDAKLWVAEGDKAQDAGDCTTAINKYRQALAVKETAQIYLRIGACQETGGKLADALQSYKAAKSLANDKTGPIVEEKISAISPRVPGVTFVLPADRPADLRVELNGVTVSDLAGETPVNPGKVRVTATATGVDPFVKEIDVPPGMHQRVDIQLAPTAQAIEKTKPPPATAGPKPSIPGIVVAAVGVVGIGVGIGLVVRGFDIKSELDDKCTEGGSGYVCPPGVFADPQALVDESNAFQIGGFVALGLGGAAATVGGVLLGLSLTAKSKPAAPPVAVLPVVNPRFVGAVAAGAF